MIGNTPSHTRSEVLGKIFGYDVTLTRQAHFGRVAVDIDNLVMAIKLFNGHKSVLNANGMHGSSACASIYALLIMATVEISFVLDTMVDVDSDVSIDFREIERKVQK